MSEHGANGGRQRASEVGDLTLPFQLEADGLWFRGRVSRLHDSLQAALSQHGYPAPVSQLLGEAMLLAAMLSDSLKFDGIFSVQAQGDGPISLIVADITSDGGLRGYARFNADRLPNTEPREPRPEQGDMSLLGTGYLAFTVDQGPNFDRYQGMVALEGETLSLCAETYFRQSEQLPTSLVMAVAEEKNGWQGGGMMLQRLPSQPIILAATDPEETWRALTYAMATLTRDELLDPSLSPATLLRRLFHDRSRTLHDARPIRFQCRCSEERVLGMLRSLPKAEVRQMREGGDIEVVCQFCSRHYRFDEEALEAQGFGPASRSGPSADA